MTEQDQSDRQSGAPVGRRDLGRLHIPLVGIFLILMLQTMVWASDFLVPVTAAVLGYFVLNRPRRWLYKLGIPAPVSALLFTGVVSALMLFLLVQMSAPAARFIEDLPALAADIERKLSASGGALEAIQDATDAAEGLIEGEKDDTVEVEVVSEGGAVNTLFSMAPSLLSQIVFALILMFFLVASGDMFLRKTVESIGRLQDKRRAVEVARTIEDRLGAYLGGITAINLGLGAAVAIAMMIWGVPGAVLLGFMAFALNFVPFIGGLVGATIATAIAFVSFDGIWPAIGVFVTYIALTSVEGQLITPMLISRRMKLNTVVVFLTVAFFAWIWSVMGMVVALPILVVVKIACDEVATLHTLGRFLGDTGPYEPKSRALPSDGD